ncbi:MAG: type II toxin-antitoxin system HicB family antitoxin [Candidatus Levybacteria bacterium]|nr:type II toxin-antitoxin system HicB family antitoxin [Candidatus Levybacteria bacterium]
MKQNVANYTVIIQKEKRMGTKIPCYTAIVPVLGIATEADTLEQIQTSVQSLIAFHIESLVDEGEEVPVESGEPFITRFEALLPKGAMLSS